MQNNIQSDPTDVAELDIRSFHEEKISNDSILLSSSAISSTRVSTLQFCAYQEKWVT